MPARVPVGRGIAAQRHAACLTGPEVDPTVPLLHARFAYPYARRLHCRNSRDVRMTLTVRNVPTDSYYVRVRARNYIGLGAVLNEARVDVPEIRVNLNNPCASGRRPN
jgi:hypothetical protein